jgi:hypothetical protein
MDLDVPFQEALEGVARSLVAELGEERLAAAGDDLERIVAESVQRAIPAVARELADDLKRDGPDMLVDRRADRDATEERLAARWGRAFDLMEMAIVVAYEAGEAFNTKHQAAAREDNDLVFAALVRLHARACRIAEEVLMLLKGGYGQGAHARWRALHEVAVIAAFLRKHGQGTAERYFLHEAVESRRAVTDLPAVRRTPGLHAVRRP